MHASRGKGRFKQARKHASMHTGGRAGRQAGKQVRTMRDFAGRSDFTSARMNHARKLMGKNHEPVRASA